jgi:hypothetical protein
VDALAVGIIDFQQFLHVGLLLGEGEVEDAEVILVGLNATESTSRWITSLLSSMRASLVLHKVEFTTVALYPARAVQKAMSRMAVVLRRCSTTAAVGRSMPKKVA